MSLNFFKGSRVRISDCKQPKLKLDNLRKMQFIRKLWVVHQIKSIGEKSESERAGARGALGSWQQELIAIWIRA